MTVKQRPTVTSLRVCFLWQRCTEHKPSTTTPSSSRCSSSSLSTSTRLPSTWLSLKAGESQPVAQRHQFTSKIILTALLLCVFRFVGYPTKYGTLFGMRNEDVSPLFQIQVLLLSFKETAPSH